MVALFDIGTTAAAICQTSSSNLIYINDKRLNTPHLRKKNRAYRARLL
jgi:hypothetical protein